MRELKNPFIDFHNLLDYENNLKCNPKPITNSPASAIHIIARLYQSTGSNLTTIAISDILSRSQRGCAALATSLDDCNNHKDASSY